MKSNLDLKGKLLGYVDLECPNCKRHRVEKFENGEFRCEKCEWNITLEKYEPWEFIDNNEVVE